MKRIRKRILAAALAAVVVITMPRTASYALEENGQTEYISVISTEPEEANVAEETETGDIEKPETEDSGTEEPKTETGEAEEKETDTEETTVEEPDSISKEDTAECICDALCTEDSINEDCPICGAEGADFSDCKGEELEEEHSIETPKRTQESGTKEKLITAWEWIDPEEYLTDGMLALPGASRRNPAFLADVTALLPEKIRAEVTTVDVAEDGEETEEETETSSEARSEAEEMDIILTGWKCANYPEDGAYEGVYTFTASLPEGFVLAEDAAALKVKVELGGAKVLAEEVSAAYQEASWNGSAVTYTNKTADCTPVADSTEAVTWDAGWYVVSGTVTIEKPITVSGDVNLILADGCTLNAAQGIVVSENNSLTIYAQSGSTGTLNAIGVADSSSNVSAGIGGTGEASNSGAVTIHSGIITASGGSTGRFGVGAAGIGGGTLWSGNGGNSGAITVYGGIITANSGQANVTGAGIGGGASNSDGNGGAGNNITIYGGIVTATSDNSGTGGAGIGGGSSGTRIGGTGSNIKIYGGTVTATGGNNGAGIGGGGGSIFNSSSYTGGTGTNISITGGIVDAQGGEGNSGGADAGDPIGNGGNASGDADVTKTAGII
ncbi:MAG: hypothetical protein K2O65_06480, partial [Lachnospiraceae bacterium]|nr:hypothetical protein [Lachnospiraceae bacterium]